MAKNKKGKVVSIKPAQLSPENYIKANARSLPIEECLITDDWEDAGICNIIVARGHKTGNVTFGIYLVDLYCLGVKDADYYFNMPADEYERLKYGVPGLERCEYPLAHNIIYGAMAYADDFGFKPHKDFSTAQFILDEDDENAELIEIEFGMNGKPSYIAGPYDDEPKIQQITKTLLRTAGEGNFDIIYEFDEDDEFEDEDGELDEFEDDEDGELDEEAIDELAE